MQAAAPFKSRFMTGTPRCTALTRSLARSPFPCPPGWPPPPPPAAARGAADTGAGVRVRPCGRTILNIDNLVQCSPYDMTPDNMTITLYDSFLCPKMTFLYLKLSVNMTIGLYETFAIPKGVTLSGEPCSQISPSERRQRLLRANSIT